MASNIINTQAEWKEQKVVEPNNFTVWNNSDNVTPLMYSSMKKHQELFFNVLTYFTKNGLSITLDAFFSFNILGIIFISEAVAR